MEVENEVPMSESLNCSLTKGIKFPISYEAKSKWNGDRENRGSDSMMKYILKKQCIHFSIA